MATYTKKNGPRGRFLYFKDGKMISVKDIPEDIVDKLPLNGEYEEKEVVAPTVRKCIFCGNHATESRFVDLQTIYLCEEDYYSKTTGKITEKLREKGKIKSN